MNDAEYMVSWNSILRCSVSDEEELLCSMQLFLFDGIASVKEAMKKRRMPYRLGPVLCCLVRYSVKLLT